jgi:hypothetical protein
MREQVEGEGAPKQESKRESDPAITGLILAQSTTALTQKWGVATLILIVYHHEA